MREISDAIKAGAEAFLKRQYRTIIYLAIALACIIYILYAFVRAHTANDPAPAQPAGPLDDVVLRPRGALLRGGRLHGHVGRHPVQHPDGGWCNARHE